MQQTRKFDCCVESALKGVFGAVVATYKCAKGSCFTVSKALEVHKRICCSKLVVMPKEAGGGTLLNLAKAFFLSRASWSTSSCSCCTINGCINQPLFGAEQWNEPFFAGLKVCMACTAAASMVETYLQHFVLRCNSFVQVLCNCVQLLGLNSSMIFWSIFELLHHHGAPLQHNLPGFLSYIQREQHQLQHTAPTGTTGISSTTATLGATE